MSKEFDQSTFELGLQGFSDSLYFTPDYLSDVSEADLDHNFFLSSALTCIPANQQQGLKSINDRIKTPKRISNSISRLVDIDNV